MKVEENTSSELYQHLISDVALFKKGDKDKIVVSTYLGLLIILEKEQEN